MHRHDYRSVTAFKAKLASRIRAINPELANSMSEVKLPWYYIKNAVETEDEGTGGGVNTGPGTEIFIYDEIGGSFGVSAIDFVEDLGKITDDNITVRINSPGGSVFDAIAIYNALIQHPASITTRVDAIAASAASIIAMAGDKVEMMIGSQLMIHDAMGVEMGNAKDMREMATFLDQQSDNLASIYANKGGDTQNWRALMLAETWMFAAEAVELGLADSVFTRAVERQMPELLEEPEEGDEEGMEEADQDEGEDQSPEEDAEAEEPTEPDEEEEDDEEIDSMLENFMSKPHRLTARGYKYAGREKAPAPKKTGTKAVRSSGSGLVDLISNWR